MRGVLDERRGRRARAAAALAQRSTSPSRDPRADVARPVQAVRPRAGRARARRASRAAPSRACTPRSGGPPARGASPSATRASAGPAGTARRRASRRRPPAALARRLEQRLAVLERGRDADRRRRPGRSAPRGSSRRSPSGRVVHRLAVHARAGRRPSARGGPDPLWSVSKRATPSSSRAHTSPSRTADGERTARPAARATSRNRSVRSVPLRLVSVASAAGDRDERAVPVPLRLEEPAPGRSGASRPASRAGASVGGAAAGASLRSSSQFRSFPSSRAGTSVQTPSARSPSSRKVRPPSRFSSRSS